MPPIKKNKKTIYALHFIFTFSFGNNIFMPNMSRGIVKHLLNYIIFILCSIICQKFITIIWYNFGRKFLGLQIVKY